MLAQFEKVLNLVITNLAACADNTRIFRKTKSKVWNSHIKDICLTHRSTLVSDSPVYSTFQSVTFNPILHFLSKELFLFLHLCVLHFNQLSQFLPGTFPDISQFYWCIPLQVVQLQSLMIREACISKAELFLLEFQFTATQDFLTKPVPFMTF